MKSPLLLLSLLVVPAMTFAATGDTVTPPAETQDNGAIVIPEGKGTVVVEQIGVDGTFGTWMLSLPDHTQRSGSGAIETLANVPSGNYVVYANLPSGYSSTIRIYRNEVLDQYYERAQTPLSLYPGENIHISIHYHLSKTGTVSVQSDPDGTSFTLNGPDNAVYKGITPQTYENMPEGQYKVQYERFADSCVKPAPKAAQLVKDERASFDIRFECDAATKVRERTHKDSQKYLTISLSGGQSVTLQDVLQKDWFSQYVFESAKRDILSGYRDASGVLTGKFGPGNPVTVAELSKIAHRMAGLSEEAFATTAPKNPAAAGAWFSPFIASSENRGWVIYADGTIDPARPATRGEVVETLMQAFDVPLAWQKGNVFTDVPVTHPYAGAIETAAAAKVVAGRTDADGKSTGIFDPQAPITRAETAKIISTMLATYQSPTTLRNAAGRAGN